MSHIERLIESLQLMIGWARDLPDEYLDGEPETRRQLVDDIKEARAAIAAAKARP